MLYWYNLYLNIIMSSGAFIIHFIYSHTDRSLSLSITCISWALTMCQALFLMFSFNPHLSWGQNMDVLAWTVFVRRNSDWLFYIPLLLLPWFPDYKCIPVSLATILLFPQICHIFWSQWTTLNTSLKFLLIYFFLI